MKVNIPYRALRGIDYTSAFLVKVWLTMNPIKGLLIGFLFFIFLNSYLLFIIERGSNNYLMTCYLKSDPSGHVESYRDSIWLTIITFLTVGYGDFYPTSFAGRYILIITTMGG